MSYDLTKPLFMGSTIGAAAAFGATVSISIIGIPVILANPIESSALKQWKTSFDIGKIMGPAMAMTSTLCSFGCAYTHYHPQALSRTYLFLAAGLSTIAIAPFTILLMMSTNDKLHAREEISRGKTDGGQKTAETDRLLVKWRNFNTVRSLLPLIGALLAFQAL